MKKNWLLKDIIDLEYFFSQVRSEEEDSESEVAHQDRQIFLKSIQPQLQNKSKSSRKLVLKLWLNARRQQAKETTGPQTVLPGSAYVTVNRLLSFGFAVISLLAGVNLASYFLQYNGAEPINVFLYISVLVLFQIILVLMAGGAFLLNRIGMSSFGQSPFYSLLGNLAGRLISWTRGKTIGSSSANQRDKLKAILGLVSGKRKIYGSLFFWPLFLLFQTSGICFNIGVLSTTIIKVITTDLAFGWQSTLQLSPEAVHTLVSTIALPWSWLISAGVAYPSLAQIEGSRMILKDGLYHLATADLVAWWPFMVLSVFCYGLIPRVVYLLAGLSAQQRALNRLDFSHNDCDRLMNRLTTSMISTKKSFPPDEFNTNESILPVDLIKKSLGDNKAIALIPDEIFDDFPMEKFKDLALENLSLKVTTAIRINNEKNTLEQLEQKSQNGEDFTLIILFEGWQPPIQEDLSFLRKLRNILPEKMPVIVALIGKPASGVILTQLSDLNWNIWNKKIVGLGDPYLRPERLVSNNAK